MKKIVLSAVAAMGLTVGVYHIALLMGASEPFTFAAAAVVLAFAVVAAVVTLAFAIAAAFAVAAAVAIATVFDDAAAAATIVAALAVAAAVDAAKQEHSRFHWVALAYMIEGLAIWGAITVGNPGWSVAIVLGGIVALLALWKVVSSPSPQERAAVLQDAQRRSIESRIAELEGELKRERDRLAALDAPSSAEAVPENGV